MRWLLEAQAKCSKDAKEWFDEHWARGSDDAHTIRLDYVNHYSVAKNKCFINIEYRFNIGVGANFVITYSLYDVYQNQKYGHVAQRNEFLNSQASTTVTECEVYGQTCKSPQEFLSLTTQFMTN